MFSVYFVYICIVMSLMPVIRYRLELCSPYIIPPPIVIANVTKERLSSSLERRHGPKKLYHIEACLLRSPYFVTLGAL